MAYKIEYAFGCVKTDLTARKIRLCSFAAMVAGFLLSAMLLYFHREAVLQVVCVFEQAAQQIKGGESVTDAIAAFYETLQEGFGG